jgi:hypothetical protein
MEAGYHSGQEKNYYRSIYCKKYNKNLKKRKKRSMEVKRAKNCYSNVQ